MNNKILVRIDFQNDFVHPHGLLSISDTDLIDRHQKFADSLFKDSFDKIIDSYDTHFNETYPSTLEAQSYGIHCVYGTWGWQQAAPFKKELNVTPVYKSTTNIWNDVRTYKDLSDDWSGKNVYLCGVLSDVCVVQALNGFLKKGANVIVIEDLCKGLNQEITDIMQNDVYQPFIQEGRLKSITSKQFFRASLLDKKIEHNMVRN